VESVDGQSAEFGEHSDGRCGAIAVDPTTCGAAPSGNLYDGLAWEQVKTISPGDNITAKCFELAPYGRLTAYGIVQSGHHVSYAEPARSNSRGDR